MHRYKEVCKYDFNKPGYSNKVGHFTQVVWKASTELGIGRYTGRKIKKGKTMTCTYIVARYRKAGNVAGAKAFRQNVSKGSFSSSDCDKLK